MCGGAEIRQTRSEGDPGGATQATAGGSCCQVDTPPFLQVDLLWVSSLPLVALQQHHCCRRVVITKDLQQLMLFYLSSTRVRLRKEEKLKEQEEKLRELGRDLASR